MMIGSSTPDRYFSDGTGPANARVFKTNSSGLSPTALGTTGAGATTLGDELVTLLDRDIIFVDAAVSGTQVAADWEPAASPERAAAVLAGNNAGIDAIIAIVGFNDANQGVVTKAGHLTAYRSMISQFRTELGDPTLPFIIGGSQGLTSGATAQDELSFIELRAAELELLGDANVYFYAHAYDLTHAAADPIHMANASYPIHATRGARNVAALFGVGSYEFGPSVTSIARVSDTQTDVTLTHSTGTDFTPTSAIEGFTVSVDGFTNTLAISAAVRQSATVVRLTHATTAGARVALRACTFANPPVDNGVQDNSARTLPLNPLSIPKYSTLALSSPTDADNGSTGALLSVTTNERNGTLYWFVSTSATPPSAAALKAGTGATAFGNQAVTTVGVQNASATGLTASTAYYAHFIHTSADGVDSAIVSGDGFTTPALVSYHATSTAYFAAMSVQPDVTRKGLIDALISGLDTDGVLTKLQALWLVGAHDAQAARTNAITPGTFGLALVSTPTFVTDRGYESGATSHALNTNYTASVSGTQDDHAIGTWVNQTNNDTGSDSVTSMGAVATNGSVIAPRGTSGILRGRINSGSSTNFTGATVADKKGLTIIDRSGASAIAASRNGDAVLASLTTASAGLPTVAYYLLGTNNAGSIVTPIGTTGRISAAFVGASLGATHRIALYNRLNTYLTAIGAN